jgi:putative oxidoreductase
MSVLRSRAPELPIERWTRFTRRLSRWGAWPLRFVIGYGFVVHGYAKLMRGPENFAVVLQVLNVPAPLFFAWATTITELIGGLCVLCGAFVAIASVPLSIVLLAALYRVHLPFGFFSLKLVEVSSG